jgi:AcrR family transcriptional regulator
MTEPPTSRSDAQRNRERILSVALEALAEPGTASMTQLARRAGVGVGTLYRHFPTREALVMALYEREVGELIELAPALLAEHDPAGAFRRWTDEVARMGRLKFGVAEVIHAATSGGVDDPAYQPFVGAIATLLTAGEAAGVVRPGTDPEAVLLLLSALWRIPPNDQAEHRTQQLLQLVRDAVLLPDR